MNRALAPRHFRYVDQPLDAFFQLDECAVVGDAHHLAGEARSDRITLGGTRPRVGHDLLHPERDAFARRVVFEHDHLDLVTDLDRFGGMLEAAPRHVGDMQQAVDSAKVDEGAVVSDVLDGAFEDHALFEHLERLLLERRALALDHAAARDDDIAARGGGGGGVVSWWGGGPPRRAGGGAGAGRGKDSKGGTPKAPPPTKPPG